jgi:hypothetical protein
VNHLGARYHYPALIWFVCLVPDRLSAPADCVMSSQLQQNAAKIAFSENYLRLARTLLSEVGIHQSTSFPEAA